MESTSGWFFLIMGLTGGLAIFLLGMDRTVSGLKGLAGNRLRWIISRLTGNRWQGAATGPGITAIIQSSSVTTVVVVGLVSGGAMTLIMSVGVIFGANVGTTITAQIIAFRVTKYALAVSAGSGSAEDLDAVEAADDEVDELHAQVVAYLGRISEAGITREQTNELLGLLEAASDIEGIGDGVETNLVADG
jgi:Na+/phosphate symporter